MLYGYIQSNPRYRSRGQTDWAVEPASVYIRHSYAGYIVCGLHDSYYTTGNLSKNRLGLAFFVSCYVVWIFGVAFWARPNQRGVVVGKDTIYPKTAFEDMGPERDERIGHYIGAQKDRTNIHGRYDPAGG